ncbi:MAG: hypothetical protein JW741_01815 [Sedimentisphaerales bacterium]|nr:hypothetical protein [Sedimentisphaerales bacterium]
MAVDADSTLEDLIARVGRVRRWLIALGAMKTAALGLACVSVYSASYAWLDHRTHFGHAERLVACAVFVALVALLVYHLVRALRRDLTYSRAAGHIESREDFDQQLIAAVEYYEGRADYPYSESLARHLVRQVVEATREFDFDATVDKKRGYLLGAFILLCLLAVGFFVKENVTYFSSYLARMLQPFSAVQPLPATILKPATGDIVTGPNVPVTLTASIEGRVPDSATLILTRPEPEDTNVAPGPLVERIEAKLTVDPEGNATATATTSFDALGPVEYRFEAGDIRSEPHTIRVCEPPAIESMAAQVTPLVKAGTQPLGTYTQTIENQTLEVLPYSRVQLQVETTTPIRKATITGPKGLSKVVPLDGGKTFNAQFEADGNATVTFDLVSAEGLANDEPLELHVRLKSDEPPQFKLVCPDGDYLTTDVASIPIAFEISDDFGLETARLCCEFPNADATVLNEVAPQGSKQARLAHTLNLEQYDLNVGDGILFYAEARDVDTGRKRADANACSEVYFIEIRPYRQYWHSQGGDGGQSSPGPMGEDLTTILEYTRAILKKTWAIAQTAELTTEQRSRFGPLRSDIEYCESRLTAMRDDPEMGFTDGAKSKLTEIAGQYTEASNWLARSDASAALTPTRNAYRLLRKFIDELHLQWSPPPESQSVPEEKPERIKLKEEPDAPHMEKERIESRLKKLQQEIDALRRQQESVKASLADTLQQASQDAGASQSPGEASSDSGGDGEPSAGRSGEAPGPGEQKAGETARSPGQEGGTPEDQGGQNSQQSDSSQSSGAGQEGQGTSPGQQTGGSGPSSGEGSQGQNGTGSSGSGSSQSASSAAPGDRPGQGQTAPGSGSKGSQGQSSAPSNGSGPSEGTSSAAQGDRSGESQATSGPGGKASQGQSGTPSNGSGSARDRASASGDRRSRSAGQSGDSAARLDAVLQMLQARQQALRRQTTQADAELGRMPLSEYSSHARARDDARERLERAVEQMKELEDTLGDLRYQGPTSAPQQDAVTDLADAIARQLAEVERALQRGLSADSGQADADQAQDIAEQLAKDAEAFDESVDPADKQDMLARLEAAKRLLESMAGVQWATVGGGGSAGAAHVYTRNQRLGPAEQARLLAREFWSLSLQRRERRIQPTQDESSDIEFFEAENEFFENAARFRPQGNEK